MKMFKQLLLNSLVITSCYCAALQAEDIDLFIDSSSVASNDLPKVLFIVDNTANWSTAFTNEISALSNTFNNLPVNADGSAKFEIGVMFASETSNTDSNVKGGYVRAAIRPMTAVNKALYADMIAALDVLKDKGNSGASSLVMAEAYRYFSGGSAYAGNNKAKADYTGNTGADWSASATSAASKTAMQAIYALPDNALSAKAALTYSAPSNSGCAKYFIIYLSNGPSNDNNSFIVQANAMLSTAGGDTTEISISPSGSQNNVSDEWARFMKSSAYGVTTYTIDVNPPSTGQGPGWTAILKSMASISNGKYVAVTSGSGGADISAAINKALSEIQAVNTVFASVSLPVSVNSQGTHLNQVYVGMFRPDQGAYPRWAGNLKQYKLGYVGTDLKLLDADDNSAVNNLTGFITECARSYWTPTTADTYWSFRPQGGCLLNPAYKNSNFPDGNVVEKGAQGYKLRSSTSRTVKTCSPTFSSCTTLTTFSTSNSSITKTLLGDASMSDAERTALISWQRGLDIDDENSNGVTTTEMRPSAHGDIVHSRPVAINFGTDASPKVTVFYGGNDGVLRAINGNRTGDFSSTSPGRELWAFIPPEFYGQIKRLRDNTTQISFPNVVGGEPKPYGVDGAVTAYVNGSDAWVFSTLRRGGRVLYSFNVNPSDPADITFKWKKGCPNNFPVAGVVDDTDCSAGFSGIGQTWSAPKVITTAGYSGPLLLLSGGYDTCEDADPNTCTTSSKGQKIYVLDADNGNLLRTFNTDRSAIADFTIVPDYNTGFAKYAYTADLGGNVYRIDIGSNTPSNWTITTVASLGCANTSSCSGNRKFMFPPDVVGDSDHYYLLLGSGDREKPLIYSDPSSVTNDVANYFFMVEDRPTDNTWLGSESANCGSAIICLDSLFAVELDTNPSATDLANTKGWYLKLARTEQVITAAITIFGDAYFSTHTPYVPVSGVCGAELGTTRLYSVAYSNGAGTSSLLPPVGLAPSPVAGLVTLDDGQVVPFCIGCSSESPLQGIEPKTPTGTVPTEPKSRVYWYIQK